MKTTMTKSRMMALVAIITLAVGQIAAAPGLRVRQPNYDSHGRFWVYRNGPQHPRMPFSPYGWMSDATSTTNLGEMMQINLQCADQPNTLMDPASGQEKDYCIRVRMGWSDATWASIAFISGPDTPPWWGENDKGRYYDLSALPHKKLVFYARGAHGGEVIKAQIGLLGNKPFGDSLTRPLASDELNLTQDWARYEMDLSGVSAAELSRVCNGFGIIAQLASQPGNPTETVFYIDDVYYE
jgi:hypothetical protein